VNEKLLPKRNFGKRPPKLNCRKYVAEAGELQFEFLLDFGSFRDLQRHRAVVQRMPFLLTKLVLKMVFGRTAKRIATKGREFLKEQEEN